MQTIKADSLEQIGAWGGFPVKIPEWSFEESFIYESTAIDFMELLDGMDEADKIILRKKVPGFSEAEGLTIDDNPVLVYYKLKNF